MAGARGLTRLAVAVEAAALPTSLPTTNTTAIVYSREGYIGTIPTEFGLLTEVTDLSLFANALTGTIPTQLGLLAQMSDNFDISSNSLSSTIPSQLGLLVQMKSTFDVSLNVLSSALPTQLGQLNRMRNGFWTGSNLLWSTIPSQLGLLSQMSSAFDLSYNYFSSAIPTQLGQLDQLSSGFWLSMNMLSSTIPTQFGRLVQMHSFFELDINMLSSTVPTQLGQLYQMSEGFTLSWNLMCGDLPTELGSLPLDFDDGFDTDDQQNIHFRLGPSNSIGTPCPSVMMMSDDDVLTSSMIVAATSAAGVLFLIFLWVVMVGYRRAARAKSHTTYNDGRQSITITNIFTPLLEDSDNDAGNGLELRSPPGELLGLTHAWQRSGAQLMVLDHELRVVLWSQGMANAMSGFRPELGTSVEWLPFPSDEVQQKVITALELIMEEIGEPMHPTLALEAAITTVPNMSLHLKTPSITGSCRDVLLSTTAIKMKLLPTRKVPPPAEALQFDNEPCHLLIMGQESHDPRLASLFHGSKGSSLSTVSDLTSESETVVSARRHVASSVESGAGNMTRSTSSSAEGSSEVVAAECGHWHIGSSTKSSSSSSSTSSDGPMLAAAACLRSAAGNNTNSLPALDLLTAQS